MLVNITEVRKQKTVKPLIKININYTEGFWSQLKIGVDGIYHCVSKKHIQKYINEFTYGYNNRLFEDFGIFTNWFGGLCL